MPHDGTWIIERQGDRHDGTWEIVRKGSTSSTGGGKSPNQGSAPPSSAFLEPNDDEPKRTPPSSHRVRAPEANPTGPVRVRAPQANPPATVRVRAPETNPSSSVRVRAPEANPPSFDRVRAEPAPDLPAATGGADKNPGPQNPGGNPGPGDKGGKGNQGGKGEKGGKGLFGWIPVPIPYPAGGYGQAGYDNMDYETMSYGDADCGVAGTLYEETNPDYPSTAEDDYISDPTDSTVTDVPANPAPEAQINMAIVNPRENGVALHFLLDGDLQKLEAGTRIDFVATRVVEIRFDRGEQFGRAHYLLTEHIYTFKPTVRGWELFRAKYVPPSEQ